MYKKRHIAKVIIDLSYQLKRDLEQAAAKHGLTRTQAVIMKYLEVETKKRDVFQRDIEKEFRIRKSSVTSVLQLLEKNGYITRESVIEDARLKKLVLTDKARNVNAIIGDGLEKREEKFYEVLSEEEVERFFQTVEKITSTLE
ncbi:MarR family winged helix-turn-helix transcriptional regulator [Candidatus Galacturonibacter soehngenii]|uniref:MarR family transcriptional regulator n=1 Tax=Candidatus Galacturonatibacter soehngenii TaxID=2307010 RepID=A0A7V7UDT2_9FIRM|nr:MarR family transcriptional regulator [Candidatus Galacturonibacter soehngenii]KAB1441031.1 MarR family transcriptional regulator [Candidatus Galacturonibacter soehngenii]MBA4688398.1 MarR family transcriptional regulator [Candidatus Galacturonibacter soehngenii]